MNEPFVPGYHTILTDLGYTYRRIDGQELYEFMAWIGYDVEPFGFVGLTYDRYENPEEWVFVNDCGEIVREHRVH